MFGVLLKMIFPFLSINTIIHFCIQDTISVGYTAQYMGCFMDQVPLRTLPYNEIGNGTMTNDICIQHCASFKVNFYAGTEVGYQCFCDNTSDGFQIASSGCSSNCYGNRSQKCGGDYRLSIYKIIFDKSTQQPKVSGTSSSTYQTTEPPFTQTTKDECLCSCPSGDHQPHLGMSKDEIIGIAIKDLNIDKKRTSAYENSKKSAKDDRPSSQQIGILGAIIILLPIAVVVAVDISNCIRNSER